MMKQSVISRNRLDIIKEMVDDSVLFNRDNPSQPIKQDDYMNRHSTSPLAFNFSDLSSIEATNENLGKFVPATREQCMNSIPVSIQILNDLVDKVIEDDERKEVLSKKRAIKIAIS